MPSIVGVWQDAMFREMTRNTNCVALRPERVQGRDGQIAHW
jgi:hypothetical protein